MKHRLMRVFSRTARDRARELDDEIEAHLAMRVADLEARGLNPQEARARALARFGDLVAARKGLYAASVRRDFRLGWNERVDDVRRDLRVALRRARSRPGHALVYAGIFGLGIGITTVMFAITDHVLIRPLPFPAADRLVALQSVPEDGAPFSSVSMGNWYDWKSRSRSLRWTGLYRVGEVSAAFGGEVSRVPAATVSGSFFETLGIPFTRGRPFSEEEAQEGLPVVVVSEGFWLRALGGRESLADVAIPVNGVDSHILGVVPAGMEFPEGVDLWMPLPYRPFLGEARNNINWLSLARLADGVTMEQAKSELSSIAEGIREGDPAGIYSFGVGVESLQEAVVGDVSGKLLLLQGSVILVLLIACGNLIGLEIAGTRERQEEISVRLALGVSRRRLLQQFVTEQLALAILGGLLGLALAAWGTDVVVERLGSAIPRVQEIHFDARIVGIGFGMSLAAGLLSAIGPAWKASRGDPGPAPTGARAIRGGRGLPGGILVSAEVSLTVILLVGGGLLLRSMGVLVNRDLGFDDEGVITLDVTLLNPRYVRDDTQVAAYWNDLLGTLEQVPGVMAVGAGNWIPTGGGGTTFVELPGLGRAPEGAGYRVVSDHYFEAMGTPLLRGRAFGADDLAGSERVVIVNEAMAETFWPDQDPIGQRVKAKGMEDVFFGGEAPWLAVIGVVGDMRHGGFEGEPRPEMFTLYRQIPAMARVGTAVVRVEPASVRSAMEDALERARAVDPAVAVQAGVLKRRVHRLMAERRLITTILVAFGIIALGLASLGVYGVLAFAVLSRRREMAIRSALGAEQRSLISMVFRSGMKVAGAGLLAGVVGALALGRVLDALLVDVSSTDPLTGVMVVSTIAVSTLVAALAPALTAARMNPVEVLRRG
ncbi:MAG: ADOP family duplicated permease [Gemmatimonadota bacterium]|jgi:predicted permease